MEKHITNEASTLLRNKLGYSAYISFSRTSYKKIYFMKKTIFLGFIILQTACASIVNDANIPVTASFSDGSAGECVFRNKRGAWTSNLPNTVMIRRSDDALAYNCESEDGRKSNGSIASEMEGAKLAASVVFFDLGITDAITDKHRTYQGNIVIPLPPKEQIVEEVDQATTVDEDGKALRELKQLYDEGLLSESVYLDRQRVILSN